MQLRANAKQDDGTDTVQGTDWLQYAGAAAATVSVSGNSWLGFGAAAEHLRVNRRDAALYNLWREEGTLYGLHRFLRIRWDGYTAYSSTSAAARLTYDVVLFEKGEILLAMAGVPTENYNGSFSMADAAFPPPTAAAPYLTFTPQAGGAYTVSNALPALPFPGKVLVRDGTAYYAVREGVLTAVEITTPDAAAFEAFGTYELPDGALLLPLQAPEVLTWSAEKVSPTRAELTATPPPQMLTAVADMQSESIVGIKKITANGGGAVMVSLSADGESWGEEMSLQDLTALDPAALWQSCLPGRKLYFKIILGDADAFLTALKLDYLN